MASFLYCNFCSTIQCDIGVVKEDFFVTNCQHIFCLKCSEHCRAIKKCPKCSKACKMIKIDDKMPEPVKSIFMPSGVLLDNAIKSDVFLNRRMDDFIAENTYLIAEYEQCKKKAIKIQSMVKEKKQAIENEKHIIQQFKSGTISPGTKKFLQNEAKKPRFDVSMSTSDSGVSSKHFNTSSSRTISSGRTQKREGRFQ